MESGAGGGGRPPHVEDTAPAKEEELTEQHRTRHGVWEVSGPESVLKAEAESESVKTLQHRGAERRAGGLNSLDSGFVMFERPAGQLGTYCTQGSANTETEDPCCSYSTETDSESLPFHPETRSFPATEEVAGNSLSSMGSLDWKPEIVVVDPAPIKREAETRSAWNAAAILGMGHAQHARPFEEMMERGERQPETQMAVSKYTASESGETHHRVDPSEKRLFYTYFERGFGRQKDSETHQSVDAGERQFSCTQCGKQFAHSANLKRHQRVHTGEKPFSCTLCEKRFSHQHQLKMHQRIHTGERPFNCTHCGKRFTQSSHIKRHLSVHTGELL
ncbi:hypothetical protein AAFF_G00265380 [Aldrovandia affinis]|uniref:C2H2-type domain-containing protein n=1 Tax=Aldrovandia affinis TaxID=143900 RepID=A0AAD7W1W8_9TELE|nr:hypothetical protein AAFF_G00265380 [Aldrovandia affinis]